MDSFSADLSWVFIKKFDHFLPMNFNNRALSSTLFNPLIDFGCSFSFRHKNTPLDDHIQRGKTVQLFYKRFDFFQNGLTLF
jgi:hypothetical protein